jgi:hypothetical protein
MAYIHGAYGDVVDNSISTAVEAENVPVYIGTAPVHQTAGGDTRVNKPVVLTNLAQAIRLMGYSEDWASYTLCEAFRVHFAVKGVGPIVVINVLDPEDHAAVAGGTADKTPSNGRIILDNAEDAVLDSVAIETKDEPAVPKVLGTDYTIAYDYENKRIIITSIGAGLGTAELAVAWDKVDPSLVDAADVIGASDGEGVNTGIFAVKDVYHLTSKVPSRILAPGFSSDPTVRAAMLAISVNINGHFDAMIFTDIPIVDNATPVTLASAATWKTSNGYDADNEKTFFPLWKGTDSRYYHLSVLFCANLMKQEAESDGLPYHTASNTAVGIAGAPYFGAESTLLMDDELANEHLNSNGITTVAYLNGWVLWGAHLASYTQSNATNMNIADTNLAMLQYITNQFQIRRMPDIDDPMSVNRMRQIVSEEQSILDAFISVGALIYGVVQLDLTNAEEDIPNGDFSFKFDVTTTPLTKSLSAYVSYTEAGLATFFEVEGA